MKRILCIVSSMNTGGAETFLMKIYRSLDKNKYQMDFCTACETKGFYEDEIKLLGGKVYNRPLKSKNPLKSLIALSRIIKENKYEYVLRIAQSSPVVIDLLVAKLCGAKKLILRAANSDTCGGFVLNVLHKLLFFLPRYVPNVKVAPSSEAALHLFGKSAVKRGQVHILNNAIKVEDYVFNQDIRDEIRADLKISDSTFVVGHVGRFNYQKNHKFLIDIFNEIQKKHPDSLLVLVGEGELQADIQSQIELLNLSEKVRFLGLRSDVNKLYSAIDVCVFPSLFEGMPNVIIEAQASGMHCVISNTITEEANITGLVDYLPLSCLPESWANVALRYSNNYLRKNMISTYVEKKYDIKSSAEKFIEMIEK